MKHRKKYEAACNSISGGKADVIGFVSKVIFIWFCRPMCGGGPCPAVSCVLDFGLHWFGIQQFQAKRRSGA